MQLQHKQKAHSEVEHTLAKTARNCKKEEASKLTSGLQ
jgi:hypothetical protein